MLTISRESVSDATGLEEAVVEVVESVTDEELEALLQDAKERA